MHLSTNNEYRDTGAQCGAHNTQSVLRKHQAKLVKERGVEKLGKVPISMS